MALEFILINVSLARGRQWLLKRMLFRESRVRSFDFVIVVGDLRGFLSCSCLSRFLRRRLFPPLRDLRLRQPVLNNNDDGLSMISEEGAKNVVAFVVVSSQFHVREFSSNPSSFRFLLR